MDAITEGKEIKFIPQCDKDCFDLGAYSQKIRNKTCFSTGTGRGAYKMDYLSVFIADVVGILIEKE